MKKHKRRKGLLLAPDDLEVGKFIAVHSYKGSDQPQQFFGLAAEIKAINLPFVAAKVVLNKENVTLDIRYLNVMPVTDDFVRAQAGDQNHDEDVV